MAFPFVILTKMLTTYANDKNNKRIFRSRKSNERGSEWLLFNANSAIVQLYHGENKLIVNEMMMRAALY
jgi:hypothetical protein